jgi:hypothetical protein
MATEGDVVEPAHLGQRSCARQQRDDGTCRQRLLADVSHYKTYAWQQMQMWLLPQIKPLLHAIIAGRTDCTPKGQ